MNDPFSSLDPAAPMVLQETGPRLPVTFVTVDDGAEGQRIDNFLITHLKGVPRTLVYRILRKGEVRVNKGRARPEQRLQVGDIVRIPPLRLPTREEPPKAGDRFLEDLEARILYEDRELMVVNKPAGLAVHGGSGVKLGLIEALRQLRPQEKMLELVHRLDRDTSGCIVVAKKRSALLALHEALRVGSVDKRYIALVFGRWPTRLRDIQAPLLKNQVASGERFVKVSEAGKAARTGFTVLQPYQGYTLVEAKPYTGRTHQIRVHARHAGFPLVADEKYSEREANQIARQHGFQRLCLHASRITFLSPGTGQKLTVEAPLPADIAEPLSRLSQA